MPASSRKRSSSHACRLSFETLEDRSLMAVMLDPKFGTGGVTTTPIPGGAYATAVVKLTDGNKLLVVGNQGDFRGSHTSIVVARYNPNGTLDRTFSGDGFTTVNSHFSNFASVGAVAIQADGKILLGGGSGEFGVIFRLNHDGTIDNTFSGDGETSVFFYVADMVVLPKGKILAAGTSSTEFGSQIGVSRLNPNGADDTTFGQGGSLSTDFGEGEFGRVYGSDLLVFADGRFLVTGENSDAFALVKYNVNGALDQTFGTGGKVTTNITSFNDSISEAMLVAGGKIVVAGTVAGNIGLARYTAAGKLDTTFGNGGKVITDLHLTETVSHIRPQSNGRILVTGSRSKDGRGDLLMVRYLASGRRDGTFGNHGIVSTNLGASEFGRGVVLPAANQIVIVGSKDKDLLLVRYVEQDNLQRTATSTPKQAAARKAAAVDAALTDLDAGDWLGA